MNKTSDVFEDIGCLSEFMAIIHKNLASGQWFALSLAEQMGNIGSEVSRAVNWQGRDEKMFAGAVDRALELFDLTLSDRRWGSGRKEVARARELLCDAVFGSAQYKTSLADLNNYFLNFAIVARQGK